MWYLIILIISLVLVLLKPTNENFESLNDPLNDIYKKDKLIDKPKEIPYSNFLIDLNDNFKNELNAVQPSTVVNSNPFKQKVLCDDHLKIEVQNKALNKSFDKISSSFPNLIVFKGSENIKHDPEAYIKPLSNQKYISNENKYSNDLYTAKIDPSLIVQNNTEIIQDIKFQDYPNFNYSTEKNDDPCVYKANQLSEYTNPRLYLSSDNTRFPPRWIFPPYKNTTLPKTTNLKLWTDMYNCCKNNF